MYNSSGMYNSMCIYIYMYVRYILPYWSYTSHVSYISQLPWSISLPPDCLRVSHEIAIKWPYANYHDITIHGKSNEYIYIHICNIPFHPIIIPNDYPMNISWFHGYPSYPVKLRMFVATSPSRSSRATRTLRSPACPGAPPCAMAPSPPPRSNSVMGGGRVRQKVVMETYNVGAPSYKLVYRHQ